MSARSEETPYDDPGWPLPPRASPATRMDGVVVLRLLFLSLLSAGLLVGLVVLVIAPGIGDPGGGALYAIIGAGIGGGIAARSVAARALDTTSVEALAGTYRANFFFGFACAEAPLLLGFVLTFIEKASWPYLVALPFYLFGMWSIAPGRRNLEMKQQELHQQGSMLSLGRVLSESMRSPG